MDTGALYSGSEGQDISCQRFSSLNIPILPPADSVAQGFQAKVWKHIHINDSGEALIEIPHRNKDLEGVAAYPAYVRPGHGELTRKTSGVLQDSPEVYVRQTVFHMLQQAQIILNTILPSAQLIVLDGLRTLDTQQKLFEAYSKYLQDAHPDWSDEKLLSEAQKMVSYPPEPEVLSISPPPHTTGGSIDCIIAERASPGLSFDQTILDFGSEFDEMMHSEYGDSRSELRFLENQEPSVVQVHRRILHAIMTQVGFSSYPAEWWHYDFGNQFHALSTHQSVAQYGYIKPPKKDL